MGKSRAAVFSKKLRALCAQEESISAVARMLGINRQQFARYLNGQTLPRDSILDRIATYFDIPVDALFVDDDYASEVAPRHAGAWQAFMSVIGDAGAHDVTAGVLQAGFYLQYQRLFTPEGCCRLSVVKVFRANGVTRCKRRLSVRNRGTAPERVGSVVSQAVVLQSGNHLFMVDGSPQEPHLSFQVFRVAAGTARNTDVLPGLVLSFGDDTASFIRSAPLVLWRIPNGDSVLGHARRQGVLTFDQVDPAVRDHIGPNGQAVPGVLEV